MIVADVHLPVTKRSLTSPFLTHPLTGRSLQNRSTHLTLPRRSLKPHFIHLPMAGRSLSHRSTHLPVNATSLKQHFHHLGTSHMKEYFATHAQSRNRTPVSDSRHELSRPLTFLFPLATRSLKPSSIQPSAHQAISQYIFC